MTTPIQRYMKKLAVMCNFGDSLAELATDPRIKVGCVVFPVDCSAVIGIGYNGAAAGLPHDSIDASAPPGTGKSGAAHAEANALVKMVWADQPSILYTTTAPCSFCAPLIVNTRRIVGVIHSHTFVDSMGLKVLRDAEIPVVSRTELAVLRGMYEKWRTGEFDAESAARIEDVERIVGWWRSLVPKRLAMLRKEAVP